MNNKDIIFELNYFSQSYNRPVLNKTLNSIDIHKSLLKHFIFANTPFLYPDASIGERIYCIRNDLCVIPKCKNSECTNNVKFNSCKGEYSKFCSYSCNMKTNNPMKTEYRYKHGQNISGENNPRYNDHRTWEELVGKERAQELKKKKSRRMKGKNNNMYGVPSPTGSGNGWAGWYKGIHFRSILELSYLKYLVDNNIQFENAEKRKYGIKYKLDDTDRTYFLDYYLVDENKFVEIKPKHLVDTYQNKIKFEEARKILKDNFVILTEDDITRLTENEIYNMTINKEVIWVNRYHDKFKEKYKYNKELKNK